MTDTQQTHTQNRRLVELGDLRLEYKGFKNPRTFTGLDDVEIDLFAENVKKHGIEVPPAVVQIKANGDIINLVIDGQRRTLAATKVYGKKHAIEVIDLEPVAVDLTPDKVAELTERALNITTNREALSSYELCEAAAQLRAQGLKNGRIATALHKSDTWVSKMLTAKDSASPKLMLSWQKGEITDEQFKDLAKQKGSEQSKSLDDVKAARESGDRAAARAVAREVAETSKAEKTAGKTKPVVKGPQEDLFKEHKPKEDDGPKPPSKVVLQDMVGLAAKKPPVHEYVKGVLDGIRVALGFTNPEKLGKPWITYLARCEGRAVAKKGKAKRSAKKSKKSKR